MRSSIPGRHLLMIITFTAGLGGLYWLVFAEYAAGKILMGLMSVWLITNGTGLFSGYLLTLLISLISIMLLVVFMDNSIGTFGSLGMAGPFSSEVYLGMLAINLVFDLEETLEVNCNE